MTDRSDRLREAAQAFIEASVLVDTITINNGPAYQDAWDAYHFAQGELRAALAEAAPAPDPEVMGICPDCGARGLIPAGTTVEHTPAPDLLAAVEALPSWGTVDEWEDDVHINVDVVDRRAVLDLILRAAPSREAGLDVEAVTDAARDMRITAADIYGAIRDLGRAGTRAEAIVFACAEAIAARLSQPTSPAGEP